MHLFLGLDGGQSSTTAMIGDSSGRVLGIGRGGPCNHVSGAEARARFTTVIATCVAKAQAALPESNPAFHAACFGFSGGPADKQTIIREMFEIEHLTVTHDALIALSGATSGRPGIITIAGTGSIAFGRNASGTTARAGGWGYIFGDEGGGFDLTRQALRAALRMEEGWGPPTALRESLLAATGASDANDLLHRFYTQEFPRPAIAGFSRRVDEAAIEGDQAAHDILSGAARQLAILAGAVRQQLFRENESVYVAYTGGAFQSDLLRERFRMLIELTAGNHCGPPEMGPAAGALLEAYRLAHLSVSLSNVPEVEK